MAAPVIQTSFAVGEVSPYLFGRVDLTKYKIGAAKMSNFLVDYKGGASKRPGTRFVGKTKYPYAPVLLVPFQFNEAQTYVLEFGYFYMRVITNGGYVLNNSGGIYETPAPWHSDDLKLLKYTQSADTMTFVHRNYPIKELIRFAHNDWRFLDFSVGATIGPPVYIGLVAKTTGFVDAAAAAYTNMSYGVTTIGEDGSESMMSPIARLINILDMTAHKVVVYITWNQVQGRLFYNVWKASTGFEAQMPAGTRLGFIGSSQGEYFVDNNILPSFVRSPPIHTDPFAPGAITEVVMTQHGGGYQDNTSTYIEIIDSTGSGAILTPQIRDGSVVGAIVENGGKGYSNPQLIFHGAGAIGSGGGTGAVGIPVVEEGFVTGIIPYVGGAGYTTNIAVFVIDESRGSGEGATATATVIGGQVQGYTMTNTGNGLYSNAATVVIQDNGAIVTSNPSLGYAIVGPKTGTYPGAVAYYQQRLLFAASIERPSTLWGSKPGSFHNFDVGIPVTDGDSYEFTLASQKLDTIKYMLGMPGGLVVLTSGGAWQLSGTQQFAPITPTQIMATPQAFHGCGDLQPITIGYEILFIQAAGSIVRNLSYNFFANIYTSADVTVLSSHLFAGRKITAWTYAEEPDKVIWLVRDDGKLLSFTFLKDQEVAGWAQHSTNGQYRAATTVREGLRDVTYVAVDRTNPNGNYTSIERLASRMSDSVEDAWFLDCALNLPPYYVGEMILYSGAVAKTGMGFAAASPIFGVENVGSILRVAGGKYRVTQFINSQTLLADEISPVKSTYYHEEYNVHYMYPQAAGTWDLSIETASVSGLSHLEGLPVSVLADGMVQRDKTVSGGRISLDTPASRVIVGLNYVADLQTLRLESQPTIQGRLKKIPGMTIRVADTRGLWAGMTEETVTELKERDPTIAPGVATPLITGDLWMIMDPLWSEDGQIWIKAPYPLPANVLAVVPTVVMGG